MKNAVSPLISTFILIVLAVSLGAVVMNWGRSGYVAGTSYRSCNQVSLNVISLNNQLQICRGVDKVRFTIENDGEVDIDGVRVIILGQNAVKKVDLKKSLEIADIKEYSVPYDAGEVGRIRKVKIIPNVEDKYKDLLCVKNGFEIEKINSCEG